MFCDGGVRRGGNFGWLVTTSDGGMIGDATSGYVPGCSKFATFISTLQTMAIITVMKVIY